MVLRQVHRARTAASQVSESKLRVALGEPTGIVHPAAVVLTGRQGTREAQARIGVTLEELIGHEFWSSIKLRLAVAVLARAAVIEAVIEGAGGGAGAPVN